MFEDQNVYWGETLEMNTEKAAPYGIEYHSHRFAAWAAGLAASTRRRPFTVETGRAILEASGFDAAFSTPEQLPDPMRMDESHCRWRENVVEAAGAHGKAFTHGVAAKLINVYLKSRFVCGGHHQNVRVQNLHPPIDAILLKSLGDHDFGGHKKEWRSAARARWSNFGPAEYQGVVALIRESLGAKPLWTIEEYWQGHQ
jgi:hypothetical protein